MSSSKRLTNDLAGQLICALLRDWWGAAGKSDVQRIHSGSYGQPSTYGLNMRDVEDGAVMFEMTALQRAPSIYAIGVFIKDASRSDHIVLRTITGREVSFANAGFLRAPECVAVLLRKVAKT